MRAPLIFAVAALLAAAGCTTLQPPEPKTPEQLVLQQLAALVAAPYRPAQPLFTVERDAAVCQGKCDAYRAEWKVPVADGPYAGGNATGDLALFYINETFIPGSLTLQLTGNVSAVTDGAHPLVSGVFRFTATEETFKDEPEFRAPSYYGESGDRCLLLRISTIKQCPPAACLKVSDDYTFCDNANCTGTFSATARLAVTNNVSVICAGYREEFSRI